jgi:hypothetical protein
MQGAVLLDCHRTVVEVGSMGRHVLSWLINVSNNRWLGDTEKNLYPRHVLIAYRADPLISDGERKNTEVNTVHGDLRPSRPISLPIFDSSRLERLINASLPTEWN